MVLDGDLLTKIGRVGPEIDITDSRRTPEYGVGEQWQQSVWIGDGIVYEGALGSNAPVPGLAGAGESAHCPGGFERTVCSPCNTL